MTKQDILRRFIFEGLGIRGEWVSLSDSWQTLKQYQSEPESLQQQLGQAIAAAVMLSATIKFNGSIILQAHGNGFIKTLVAQATHDRKIRGLVRSHTPDTAHQNINSLFGQGYLALTVMPTEGEPYQGIVALQGDDIGSGLENYFSQSEQLPTRVWLFATDTQVVGLLLQGLPNPQQDSENWLRIEMLADTLTAQELLTLDCEQILYRLFNEEQVRLFDPEPITFVCSCSREKINTTLRALGREELESILQERKLIEVNCDFCNAQYHFDKIDVEVLLASESSAHASTTQH